MNISCPIGSQIDSVSFSLYEPDEIRKISVKQIVNPVLFDALGHPTKGGLYDPALGPCERSAMQVLKFTRTIPKCLMIIIYSCGTCSQDHFNCPGHFGHIEIPIPTYNPLFFDTLYALLRARCACCNKFRLSRYNVSIDGNDTDMNDKVLTWARDQVQKVVAKLKLLQHGLIREAQALDDELGTKKKEKKPDSDNLEDRMEEEGKALDIEDELIDGIGKVLKTYELAMEY